MQKENHYIDRLGGSLTRVGLTLWVLAAAIGFIFSGGNAAAQSTDYVVFLPVVMTAPICELSATEAQVEALFLSDPNQTRVEIGCNYVLSSVARGRAEDMARREYFDHVNPDGIGPNQLVQSAGFDLPDWYDMSDQGNNIESIAAGQNSPQAVWRSWMDSPSHRRHLLGEVEFYRNQTVVGIGHHYDPNSKYGHYWVIITAPPSE